MHLANGGWPAPCGWCTCPEYVLAVQVGAVREELAAERKLREEAEQALDRDRRTLQLASITSGAGTPS